MAQTIGARDGDADHTVGTIDLRNRVTAFRFARSERYLTLSLK